MTDLVIIGGGPAGMSAAVEAYKSAENWDAYEYLIQPMPQE